MIARGICDIRAPDHDDPAMAGAVMRLQAALAAPRLPQAVR